MAFSFKGSGFKAAQPFEKGQYLLPGRYQLEIIRCIPKKTRAGADAFIAEFKVLESDNPEITVGGTRSWYQATGDQAIAFPALMEFLQAVLNPSPEEEEEFKDSCEDTMDAAISEENALGGSLVEVECYNKKTNKGNDFTVHIWKPEGTFDF
jgi:hypothetical protein